MDTKEAKRKYFTTDLWCECGHEENAACTEKETRKEVEILRGKSIHGSHVTLKMRDVAYTDEHTLSECANIAAEEMLGMIKHKMPRINKKDPTVLAICLGNRHITSDAIGPLCAESLSATYHLKDAAPELYSMMGEYRLAVIAPGTQGESGIEPSAYLSAISKEIQPDIIIAIDALAAGCDEYIGRTLQISTAGITPGSGVGNAKRKISSESTGKITLGIGIPTVISSSTLIYNALEKSGMTDIPKQLEEILENNRSFFVAPKHTDLIATASATLLSQTVMKFCERITEYPPLYT